MKYKISMGPENGYKSGPFATLAKIIARAGGSALTPENLLGPNDSKSFGVEQGHAST
jgi:hypothetical protein